MSKKGSRRPRRNRGRVQNSAPIRVQNSTNVQRSKMGGVQDQGVYYRTARCTSHPLDSSASSVTRAREWIQLYYKEWTAQKIIDIPVGDMLRGGWGYSGGGLTEEMSAKLKKFDQVVGFPKALRQCSQMERLLGGAVGIMGIASDSENQEDLKEPLNPNSIDAGDLRFINPVPRNRVSRVEVDTDPMSAGYNMAKTYWINGVEIHRSRLLVFDGNPLTQHQSIDFGVQFLSRDGFGESVLAPIWDDIMRAVGSRQAAYHLINRASVLLLQLDSMQDLLDNKQGKSEFQKLDNVADQLSMYQAAVIGKDSKVDQFSANFGRVPELVMNFLQVISAASDIPATRFLGQAPGGLNATGESDLENYYNSIDESRDNKLRPIIQKWLNVAVPSVFGKGSGIDPNEIEIEFSSLWQLNDVDAAAVRSSDSTSISTLVTAGIISEEEAIVELRERGVLVTDATDPEKDPELGALELDDTDDGSGGSIEKLKDFVDAGGDNGGTQDPQEN